ncbi:MAG: alpha/beta fold hydrolase [Deltaproteobacteria bacterium]|nr:alpha/beta fold hydrolase [Candidatus Zymogenaceae bacterium]
MSLEALYPYPVKRVTLAGHECAYIDEGVGTPIIFLHGFSVNLASFAPIYPALVDKRRVIGLDYPGYYLSEKKAGVPYDIPFMAGAVAEMIEKLGLDRAVLLGSSMGGAVAQEAALIAPDAVSALVLAAPAGFSGRSRLLASLLSLQRALLSKQKLIDAMTRRLYDRVSTFVYDKESVFLKDVHRQYDAMREREDYPVWIETLLFMAREVLSVDFRRKAGSISVPTLIVWGDKDEVLPPEGADVARKSYGPNMTLEILPDVGHIPFAERPDEFTDLVDGFLSKHGL